MTKKNKKPSNQEIIKGMRWSIVETEIINRSKKAREISGKDLVELIFGDSRNNKGKSPKEKMESFEDGFKRFVKRGVTKKKFRLKNKGKKPRVFEEYLFSFELVSHYLASEKFKNKLELLPYLEKEGFEVTHPLKNWFSSNKIELDRAVEALSKALDRLDKIENAEYDGVQGSLPGWMPEPLKQEFHNTRMVLLETKKPLELRSLDNEATYSAKDILTFMNSRLALTQKGSGGLKWFGPIPDIFIDKVDALNYIKSLADLDEKEGINAYLGKSGASVYRTVCIRERQSKAAKKSRMDGLSRYIFDLLKQNLSLSNEQILDSIKKNEHRGQFGMIDDFIIEFQNPPGWKNTLDECEISALPHRINKIRKKLKKA